MKGISLKLLVLIIVIISQVPCQKTYAYTDYTEEVNFVYNRNGESMKIPTAYEHKKEIHLMDIKELTDYKITSPVDMFVKESGELFVVESELGAILIFDENQKFVKILDEFTAKDGTKLTLKKPQGVFVTKDNVFYIADTENNRVLVCDSNGTISSIVEKPENILGTDLTSFLPIKVVVDSAGRISIVARNINSGIMQFTKDGIFTGYSGAPSVSVDVFTKFLKKFSTKEQKAQMQTFVPTEYNNIKISSNNFIWGSISAISGDKLLGVINSKDNSGSITPIKKLNTMGVDVLRRKGIYPPVGKLAFYDSPSKIVDIGLGPNQIYSMLDSYEGKIFTYNNDGILLYTFGNKGTKKGNFQTPVAIDYIKNDIYVLDSGLCQILVYEPTNYGRLLIDAEGFFQQGEYELANDKWREVAERNSNFEYAYVGLGNAKYNVNEFRDAMDYFEYADDSENYSKAKEQLRKNQSETIFPVLFMIFFIGIVAWLGLTIGLKVKSYVIGEEKIHKREEEA